jgi:hypothetical protein
VNTLVVDASIALKWVVGHRLQSDLGIKVMVDLVEEGSLAPVTGVSREGTAKRLLDLRQKQDVAR